MSRTRKSIIISLCIIAILASGYVAYRFTLLAIHAEKYSSLRDQYVSFDDVQQSHHESDTQFETVIIPEDIDLSEMTLAVTEVDETTASVDEPDYPEETETETVLETELPEEEETKPVRIEVIHKPDSPVDFVGLQKINSDIYAWIEIPGTSVSYPVLQDPEDINYYLRHLYDGSYSIAGSIFSEPASAKDFSDYNTVLYGHNFGTSYMFGALRAYRDDTFLKDHRTINVYTPYATLTYRVWGAVVYSSVLINAAYDQTTESGRQQFLNSVSSVRDLNSHLMNDMTVTTEDKLLTLSTCTGDGSKRYLVIAVLEETK